MKQKQKAWVGWITCSLQEDPEEPFTSSRLWLKVLRPVRKLCLQQLCSGTSAPSSIKLVCEEEEMEGGVSH